MISSNAYFTYARTPFHPVIEAVITDLVLFVVSGQTREGSATTYTTGGALAPASTASAGAAVAVSTWTHAE